MISNFINIIKKKNNVSKSYTLKVFRSNADYLIKKILEEIIELLQINEKYKIYKNCYYKYLLIKEITDIIFHLILFILYNNISVININKELFRRNNFSGIFEKNNRYE